MNMQRRKSITFIAAIISLMTLIFASTLAQAASVVPVVVTGNPSCTDLGYEAGFKIEPVTSGTLPYPTESTRLLSPSMALPLTGHPQSALMQSSLREGQIPISMYMIHPPSRLGILSYRPRSIQTTVNLSV